MMLPGLVLFFHIATAYAQFNSNKQENIGPIQGPYPYRNKHIQPRIPSDRTNWNTGVFGSEAIGRDEVELMNQNKRVINTNRKQEDAANIEENQGIIQAYEIANRKDNDLDDNVKYLKKRLKGRYDLAMFSNNLNYNKDSFINRRRAKGTAGENRNFRYIRELRQQSRVTQDNGLPVWSYLKPEKNSKSIVTNRNGSFSGTNAGELSTFYDDEETSTEEDDRMAFIGGKCPMGYAKVLQKCVPIH